MPKSILMDPHLRVSKPKAIALKLMQERCPRGAEIVIEMRSDERFDALVKHKGGEADIENVGFAVRGEIDQPVGELEIEPILSLGDAWKLSEMRSW